MAEAPDSRDSENNWVIASSEGLAVETLGAEQPEAPRSQQEAQSADVGSDGSAAPTDPEQREPRQPPAAVPAPEETTDIPVEEPDTQDAERPNAKPSSSYPGRAERCVRTLARFFPDTLSLGGLKSWAQRRASRTGEDLEEVSCSSSDDDVEGLRKRVVKGASPVNVGAGPKEPTAPEEEGPSGLTLNKCIVAALALAGIGFLLLSGGFVADDDPPQTVITRSTQGGDGQPRAVEDVQDWIKIHAAHFTGDPGSLAVVNELLDRVAKENQDIRQMQANLQAQKEELESMLRIGEDEGVSAGPPHQELMEENIRLKDALLKEETLHLSAREELQSLREKTETMEVDSLEMQRLVSENAKLKEDLDSSKKQIEGFLIQKEILVAEAQMLRQELDKQRSLVGSIRRDLESLTAQKSDPEVMEDEQQLQDKISDMNNRLALELQRSETWEKTYVEHAQRRKEQVKDQGHKEGKKREKSGHAHHTPNSEGEFRNHRKDQEKPGKEGGQKKTQHEEWTNHDVREDPAWHGKKQRHPEGDHHGKGPAHKHHENRERGWKERPSKYHHEEEGGEFHPRKGQKEFREGPKEAKEDRKRKVPGEKAHGKDHRHHDHNKFWKKLSDHQYRVPEGCSGVEGCARKDGIDLFNVELKPVQRKQFEDVLRSYLAKVDFSKHLPELIPLLDGFFEGPVFSHDKIRFRDFVDDMEDFLEGLARRETGNDDAVDDFEKYVYANFFGEAAAGRKRSPKKKPYKEANHEEATWEGTSVHQHRHHYNTQKRDKNQPESRPENKKPFKEGPDNYTPDHVPAFNHQDQGRRHPPHHRTSLPPDQLHVGDESSRYRDPTPVNHRYREEGQQSHKPSKHRFAIHEDRLNDREKPKPSHNGEEEPNHGYRDRDQHGHDTRQKKYGQHHEGKKDHGREAYANYHEHGPKSEKHAKGEHKHNAFPRPKNEEDMTPYRRHEHNDQSHSHRHRCPDHKPWKEGAAHHDHRQPDFTYTKGHPSNPKLAGEERRSQHQPYRGQQESPPGHEHGHNAKDGRQRVEGVAPR
ncbi:pre-B-cell leukemia transcription factor-interacting protein 1 [Spea bombifrons]|uniref:pre-B-cell leukemia transcription factor-interacting protein 1 n=1 Tax=Spea bombifrons TaxID=233779 RepID=UPI00234BF620|nr:pre-B-cell leukemia transcription factor-interacting protein 1 [Spea bombifrons]